MKRISQDCNLTAIQQTTAVLQPNRPRLHLAADDDASRPLAVARGDVVGLHARQRAAARLVDEDAGGVPGNPQHQSIRGDGIPPLEGPPRNLVMVRVARKGLHDFKNTCNAWDKYNSGHDAVLLLFNILHMFKTITHDVPKTLPAFKFLSPTESSLPLFYGNK